tara:strand:+ start:2943 stop:3866 length:924 start_codon:yes stop_codon:yes gene_type:complete
MIPKFKMSRRNKIPVIDFLEPIKTGECVSLLVQADEHFDNVHTDQSRIKRHMQDAVNGGWPILKVGDQLCLMQGKTDGRANKADLRDEHKVGNYIDAVVNDYAAFCEFAAPNIALLADGNHEVSVRTRLETNVTERVGEQLRMAGSALHVGGIGGWILVKVRMTKTANTTVPIFYHHGHGGGGMGRGVGHVNKRALYLPDAQIVLSGHIHEEYAMTLCRDRINIATGRTYCDESTHVVTGTYKDEYDPEGSTWHSVQGRPPKPIGGTWVDLVMCKDYDETLKPSAKAKAANSRLPRYFIAVNVRRAK